MSRSRSGTEKCRAEGSSPGQPVRPPDPRPLPAPRCGRLSARASRSMRAASLKPSNYMQTSYDMGGAAPAASVAATGTPWPSTPSSPPTCAASFKLGDIPKYFNGVSVEIHSRQGRLILADALTLACEVPGAAAWSTWPPSVPSSWPSARPASSPTTRHVAPGRADDASELIWRLPLPPPTSACSWAPDQERATATPAPSRPRSSTS